MRALLMRAYDVKWYQVSGPAWMDSERYEVDARMPEGATKEQVAAMLRTLLIERFHLAARVETRQLPVYELLVRGNPKLKTSEPASSEGSTTAPKIAKGPNGLPEIVGKLERSFELVLGGPDGVRYQRWARRESMQDLADILSDRLDRPVVDQTGLRGTYDYELTWAMEGGGGIPRTGSPPDVIEIGGTPVASDSGLNVFAAIQAQLGLKLQPGKGPVRMLVVDRIDNQPTEN